MLSGAQTESPANVEGGALEFGDRYAPRTPESLVVKRLRVMRQDYVEYVRSSSAGFENGPDLGLEGPRRALPALAVALLDHNPELADGVKKTLRHYSKALDEQIKKERAIWSFDGGYLCAMHFYVLRQLKFMSEDDERLARELLLKHRQYQFGYQPGDGLWRGTQYRAQVQGINHALAAALCPDEPDAPKWKIYADAVWSDWWKYRDLGMNDVTSFYTCLESIVCAAIILDRPEIFTDNDSMQHIWARVFHETPPDGGLVPYGAHSGHHSMAGAKIFALETGATMTRDGRFKYVAQRVMNFGQRRGFSSGQTNAHLLSISGLALASLVCDDRITPVPPDPRSRQLWRKDVVRLEASEAKKRFPEAAGVDEGLWLVQRMMPNKLVFRSGWNPGDLFMLLECYVRHEPINPTAIYALERYSSAFTEAGSGQGNGCENAVRIEDLSGEAVFTLQTNFTGERVLPKGYLGMAATVPEYFDHAVLTHARLHVTNYMGFSAEQDREVFFIKNRFVVVRDETLFRDRFRARVGPVWNTQHVGEPRGEHWINTWFSAHFFQNQRLHENPPHDLLICHAPRPDTRLIVADGGSRTNSSGALISTRYAWEGAVQPGMRLQFVQVFLPHAPARDASALAKGIQFLKNEPGMAAVTVRQGGRVEMVLLNRDGAKAELTAPGDAKLEIETDARQCYVVAEAARPKRVLLRDGSYLAINREPIFVQINRGQFEKEF